jgi:hypothetical protein
VRAKPFAIAHGLRALICLVGCLLGSATCLAQSQAITALTRAIPSIQAQLVFEGAHLAGQQNSGVHISGQQMSTYRLVTKLSPERLLAEVESIWSRHDKAKVWRSQTDTWQILSKVEQFPEVEVLQVRRGAGGETIARLSVGAPSALQPAVIEADLLSWLPVQTKLLQSFSSADPGRSGHLIIARSTGSLQGTADWMLSQALRHGFKPEPNFRPKLDTTQSRVEMLARGTQEITLTLDQSALGVAIVLQHQQVAR